MARRSRGEPIPDSDAIAANPDLMPELARELSMLSLLERARESATGANRSRTGRRFDGSIQPLGDNAFEGYRVVKEIHRGGQGVVYEATQASTGRRVAIKMMREGLFAGDRDAARFEREVRILGQLEHPGIVRIIASGIRAGHFYYVMDYVEGRPLDEHASALGRRPREVFQVMERVADAVNAAHLRGIIHRDLKPGNILVDDSGQPRILDFGLARITAEKDVRMTATGQFIGSMPWASPEQASGEQARVDLRTDVYSLGVILYQALTGSFPYAIEGSPRDVLNNIMTAAPGRFRSTSHKIDSGAAAITLKCLAKERERRYQSAGELGADIHRYLSGRPVLAHSPSFGYQLQTFARRHKAIVIGAAAVLLTLILGLIGTTRGLIVASHAKVQALHERDTARTAQATADQRRAEAEILADAANIAAADSALRADDSYSAKKHLRAVPPDRRGWEWRYLAHGAEGSQYTFPQSNFADARMLPGSDDVLYLQDRGRLTLQNLQTHEVLWSIQVPDPHARAHERAIAGFSRDGHFAVTQHDDAALVWDTIDGSLLKTLVGTGTVWGWMSAAFSRDGTRLAISGRMGKIAVWDLSQSRIVYDAVVESSRSAAADYSPDGRYLALNVSTGVLLLDARTHEQIRTIRSSRLPTDCGPLRFTADGSRVVACFGGFLSSLDPEGVQPEVQFRITGQDFLQFDLSPDGKYLVAGSWDSTARVFELATGTLERTLTGHEQRVFDVSFTPDGSQILTCSSDGRAKLWDGGVPKDPGILGRHAEWMLTRLSNTAVAAARSAAGARLVDASTGTDSSIPAPPIPYILAASPDSKRLACAASPTELRLWDSTTSTWLWTADVQGHNIVYCRFTPDGSSIVTTSGHEDMCLWDATTGKLIRPLPMPPSSRAYFCISPLASQVVAAGYDGQLYLMDTSGAEGRVIPLPADLARREVLSVAYNADASLLASGVGGGDVIIWDTVTWKSIHRISGMPPGVWAVAFSPDGRLLAAGSQDRMIHIFRTSDWSESLVLRGHTGNIIDLSWTPDGGILLSAGGDGTIRAWRSSPLQWKAE
jgi:WD40 repeat protein/predicted Ser/Thr protein kinase